ncbi:MAG TPA: hypothetical protein VHY20_06510 [Pirellulales bacterium]|nr:hypothetical protein [Pirellulales bacterium]
MLRYLAAFTVLALLGAGEIRAAEVSGKVKKVDADAKQLTLIVGGSEKTYQVADDAKVVTMSGKAKKPTFTPVAGGLKGLNEGSEVSCFTDNAKDDTFIEIRLMGALKKKKKDK